MDTSIPQDAQPVEFTSANGYLPSGRPIKRIPVKLLGKDGNAFAVLARVRQAMRFLLPDDIKSETMAAYQAEAIGGDYNHLLMVTMRYCDVD